MTRETKLGIAVAGTFLTLVGVWAGIKFFRGEPPSTTEQAAATETETKPDAAADPKETTAAAPGPAATTGTSAPQPLMAPANSPPGAVAALPADNGGTGGTTAPAPNSSAAPAAALPVMAAPTSNPPPPDIPLPVPPTSGAPTNAETPAAPSASATPPTGKPSAPPDPPAPVMAPPTNPPASSPVVEAKKDEPPPPAPITINTKPADPPSPEPTVTVVPTNSGSTATLGPPGVPTGPPVPASPTGASPARPKSEPRVQSYLEEEYRWQPGDSFAAVSQKFYFSDKYAAALQQYNRDYPLAGLGMRQNPPTMMPGQAVWAPPVRILERDYPNLIADLRPLNDRGMPIVPTGRSADSTSPNGATRLYKVRAPGETLYEIARRTLGDSANWFQVHRLNPTLSRDPKLPIPAGTMLRLPGEAKVDANDQ